MMSTSVDAKHLLSQLDPLIFRQHIDGIDLSAFHLVPLEVSNLHAEAAFREHGEAKNTDGDWNLSVTGNGTSDDERANLTLDVSDGASIALNLGTAADAREARS